MSEKGSTRLLDFIKKIDQDFCLSSCEWQNLCIEKCLEGYNNFQDFVIPDSDDTKMLKKNFKSILHYVKQTIWKPWSDCQHEFVVLTCSEDEAFNIINCLSVLSAIAFKEGDTTSLEEIQRIVVQYQHHPGTGFVMNNLGVMFSENAMYKMSEKCFNIAKSYFERTLCRQDNQRDACAVVTLNLAVLHMVLGNYEEAEHLSDVAASLCLDISMITTKDVHLPWKLLRRVADMLKEFGNYKKLHIIREIGVHYGVSGTDEGATNDLTKQLMKIQLKEECGKAIQAEEVEDYIYHLFALLDKPAAELLNAEFIGTVMSAAKIHRNIGHHEEACKLLEKLKNTFLLVHGGRRSLYGSLLYQIGSFLHGSGKFDEAESLLKQAEEILFHHFGRSHHAVAMCKSLLGSCCLLKGNTKAAFKHLNEALTSAFGESVNTLFMQPKFRKGFLEGKDFYMKLTVPTGPGDVSSLCSQIDCLPLLVELKLSESQEQCDNFDYLTSWEQSVKSVKPSAHVSYFSYKCSSQRETEFVFDHLIHSLDQNLALNNVQSVVSPLQNAAAFFLKEPRNSSLSVTVDSQSVLVKCRTIKESELNCICSSVRNALNVAMESCQTVGVNFESSAWLTCEGVGSGLGIEESSSRNCYWGVQSDPSCAALTSGTGDLIPCASARSTDPESELKRKPTADAVDMLQDENMEVDPPVGNPHDNFHADVDVCLCLLSCLLSQAKPVFPEEEVLSLNSSVVSSTDFARCDSNIQDNHDYSFLSVGSSSSLNSLPLSPPIITASGHCLFTSKKSPSECLSSENNAHPLPETSTCMNSKHVSRNSSTDSYKGNGLSVNVKLPEKPSPDGCHILSYEAGLTAGECRPGPETKETKQLEDSHQLQISFTGVGEEEMLLPKWHEDLHVHQKQQQDFPVEFPQNIPGPSSAASSEKIDAGTLTDDCPRPLRTNLEDDLAISQKKIYELQQWISQLEEQLRQSKEEKQNLQADLGKYLFLEGKEKRRERLLGRADPVQDPGPNHSPGQSMPVRKHELSDHATNSPTSMTAQDNSIDISSDRHDNERHSSNGGHRNDHSSRTEETDYDCSQYASISSSGSSDETYHYTTENELTCGDMVVLCINAESDSSSSQSTSNGKKCTQLPNSSDDDFLSDSSCSTTVSSSDSLLDFTQTIQAAASNCTSQASSDSTEGSPMLTSVNSQLAFGSNEISSDSGLTPNSSEEENLRSSEMLAYGGEESKDRDVSTRTNSSDSSTCSFVETQSGANVGNLPWSQPGAFPSGEMAVGTHTSGAFNGTATDWERQGARPKQGRAQHSFIKQMPGEPFIPVTDGLAGDFLARHTQDKDPHDSLYQSVDAEMPLFNDTPSQGASSIDGVINVSDSNKAKPYFGDCQAVSGTDPYSRFDGRGISYSEHLNNNTGPSPRHLGGNSFSVYGNYSQRNGLNATNGLPLQSGFVHNNSRFSEHFGGAPHLPLEIQQGPSPSVPSNRFLNSGVTGSSFADLAWNGTTEGTQSGHPVYGAQGYTSFNDNASTSTSAQSTRQTPQNTNLAQGNHSSSTTNNDNVPSTSSRNIPHEDVQNSALPAAHAVSSCDPTRAIGLDSTTTVGDEVLAQGSASGTSIPQPSFGNADNHRASIRDFVPDSVESTDNSLVALEQRVAKACALVERVLREREEREQFGREIERKEQLIREQRARERREREEREIQEAERWPQQQEAITARSQWLCEHYQRHCRVRFPCCTQFYPCHRCHNISKACDNEEAKACHASHLKCSHCQHEQEIGEDSEKCHKCGGKMSAYYFCSICKHFTSIDKNPYHCEKCGICRIRKDKSFHRQGNHKCRPDSGHDECCICLEDAFSGCQILPCSHKVHRECAIAMIQNGIRTCPICRHPLYSPPRE